MKNLLKIIPTSLKYTLTAGVMYLLVSLVYPNIKAAVYASRGYEAIGGEMFIWFVPFMVLYAYDTWKHQREIEE